MKNLKRISPDYPRIAHLDSRISKMTHDDIVIETDIKYPFTCYESEKLDGANLGISWVDGSAVVRNKNFILKKGYSKIRTPAKSQFKSTWNFVNEHKNDIIKISNILDSDITIYGEWLKLEHSVKYNSLPSPFMAYDIWVVEDDKFLSPKKVEELLKLTNIPFIKHNLVTFNSLDEIVKLSEKKSDYSDTYREGIVLKTVKGNFIENYYKIVNKFFNRREDFNSMEIKNAFIKIG